MPKTSGFTRTPRLVQGAIVQLNLGIGGLVPNTIVFQYNPEQISRSFTPFRASDVNDEKPGAQMPQVQPFSPQETINFSLELDATDGMEEGQQVTTVVGVSDRLAALEKLVFASEGTVGDLINSVESTLDADFEPRRKTVPVTLLIYGLGRSVPVRVTSMSVTETHHSPTLQPIHAKVDLGFDVVTPEDYMSGQVPVGPGEQDKDFAVAAYKLFRVQRDALAIRHAETTNQDLTD